jgi:hypothetical protein
MIILTLQIFVALFLLNTVFTSCKKMEIPIDFHSISTAIFFGVIIFTSIVISYKDFNLQLIIGGILYIYNLVTSHLNRSKLNKLNIKVEHSGTEYFTSLLLYLLFWSHVISFNYFVRSNYDKIIKEVNEDI